MNEARRQQNNKSDKDELVPMMQYQEFLEKQDI